ncbi:heme exporter protein CcmD, partial [Aromatoleum toluclasticum]
MGGVGLYVWSAYLVAIVVIFTEIAVVALRRRSILEHL